MPEVIENAHNRDQSFARGFSAYRGSSADQALIGGRAVKMMRSTFTDGQRSYIAWDVTGGISIEQARPAVFCTCPRETNGRILICPHLVFMDFLFDVYSRTWDGHTGSIDLSTSYQRARNSPKREYLTRLLYRQWRAERQIVRLPESFLGQTDPPAWLDTLPNLWQQVIATSGRRECPNCGQLSRQATDTNCPSCGARYPWAPPDQAVQPQPAPATNGPHPPRPVGEHPLSAVPPVATTPAAGPPAAPSGSSTAPTASNLGPTAPPTTAFPGSVPAPTYPGAWPPASTGPAAAPPVPQPPPAAPAAPHSLAGIAAQPAPAPEAAPAPAASGSWLDMQDPSAAGAWLARVEETLRDKVIGQDAAIEVVLDTLQIALAGLAEHDRPLASFLFAGPTGVGKTSLAQAIAETMPGGRASLLKIDCGELKSAQDVGRLFGAAPGYVGYEQGGQLVNHIRKFAQGIVLYDEMEKADPEVLDPLLSLLEDPDVTDSKGNSASARDYLYVSTTNVGSRRFISSQDTQDIIHEAVREDLQAHFRPELINRFDAVLIFNDLPPEVLRRIAVKELDELAERIAERGKKLTWDDKVVDFLVSVGATPGFGARPIVRAVRYRVKSPLARFLLQQGPTTDEIRLTVQRDRIVPKAVRRGGAPEPGTGRSGRPKKVAGKKK